MNQGLYLSIFNTSAGWVGALGSDQGLLRLTFPMRTGEEARQGLDGGLDRVVPSPRRFQELEERLRGYFDGQRVDFPDRLDLSAATAFQRQVWEATRLIPYGETRSYAWVARRIKQPLGARAVGQALGRNPLPIIIPCHRVLNSNGGLGGFGGGLPMKRFLLRLEKIQ